MSDLPFPVSPAGLINFGFRVSTSKAAAQEIAELAHAVFGPFDPEAAEVWALSEKEDLGPAELRQRLAEAAQAEDPLVFLAAYPDAQAMLERGMRLRWSSRRARDLGHPASLEGQTWSSLSEGARAEVKGALGELEAYADTQVLRYRAGRDDLDTFLSELAEIYVMHARQAEDRGVRARRPLRHRTDVPHSPTSRFIQLANRVLSGIPRPLPDDLRLDPNLWTARSLSIRWKRRKEVEVFGRREKAPKSKDSSPT
jgi:hypothetical protein